MKSVCVFCASSDNIDDAYLKIADELADEMLRRNLCLVYGGGNNGLMGRISRIMHERGGGRIVGVIPRRLMELGYGYDNVDEMIVTDGMRERKAIMEERADAFIGMPGGVGTLEELLEIVTLRQLEMLDKPIVFLNIRGYFDGILAQFERAYEEHFMDESCRELYFVTDSVSDALDHIAEH